MFDAVRDGNAAPSYKEAVGRVLAGGVDRVDVGELLGLILGEKASERVSAHYGPEFFRELPYVTAAELLKLEGVGPVSVARLWAALEMGRRSIAPADDHRPILSNSYNVIEYCQTTMMHFDREHFWVLALNAKNRLIRRFEASVGIVDATIVHPREVFKGAILVSACSIVLVHNHPSGDPTPSVADISMTRRLCDVGDTVGIRVLDHIVIGEVGRSLSLFEEGYIDR